MWNAFILSPVFGAAAPLGMISFSQSWTWGLACLSILLLASGADDLAPVLICLFSWFGGEKEKAAPALPGERRIAIFVPCWREAAVIGKMVRHNLAAIRYSNFDLFIGAYPNDDPMLAVAGELESEFQNVHAAVCRDPGPTSKADCLNWIYRRMQAHEAECGVRFDTVVLHDAEDLIHPEALALIHRERAHHEMVQVPVLPLPTGFGDVTHGVYCDEFAEYQMVDMRARHRSGAFVPSNGVGTGFAREILEGLAAQRSGDPFDPSSLTEDYEIGVAIHASGYRQIFCPLKQTGSDWLATREYFPRTVKTAVRQRTRWVIGIALQTWERHGWAGSWQTRWWFWRDRKGLVANPLSALANLLFLAGVFDYPLSAALHQPWLFYVANARVAALCEATLALQCLRLCLRCTYVAQLYGLTAALGVPLRSFHANLINCSATFRALWTYFGARRQRRTVAWQKTDHAFPHHRELAAQRRALADVLTGYGYVSEWDLQQLQENLAEDSELDLLLLARGLMNEDEMCKALSLQSGLPAARVDESRVNAHVLRALPAHLEERYRVVPYQVKDGRLLVAAARVPSAEACAAIETHTRLPVEFRLVTRSTYQKLLRRAGTPVRN